MKSEEQMMWVNPDSIYDIKKNSLLKPMIFDVEYCLDSLMVPETDHSMKIERLCLILMIQQQKAIFHILELMIFKLDKQGLLMEQFKELANTAEAQTFIDSIQLEPIKELVTAYISQDLQKYHQVILTTIKSIGDKKQPTINQANTLTISDQIISKAEVPAPCVVDIQVISKAEQLDDSKISNTMVLTKEDENQNHNNQPVEENIQIVEVVPPTFKQILIDNNTSIANYAEPLKETQVQLQENENPLVLQHSHYQEQTHIQITTNPQVDIPAQIDSECIEEEFHLDSQPQIDEEYQRNCPLYSGMSILDLYHCLSKLDLQSEWWLKIDYEFKQAQSDIQIQQLISRIAPILLNRFMEQKANSLNPTFESQYNDIFESDKDSRQLAPDNQNENTLIQQIHNSLSMSADSIISEEEVIIDEKQTQQSLQNKLIQYYQNPHYREFQPHQFDPALQYLVNQQDMIAKLKSLTTNKLYDIFIDSLLKEESNAIFQNKEFENILIVIYNVMKILNHRYSTEIHCVQEDKYFVALFELKLKDKLLERKVEKHLSQTKTNILIRLFAIKFMLIRCYHIPKPMMIFDLIELLLAKIPQKRLTQPTQDHANECQILNPVDNYQIAYQEVNSKKCHKKQQEIQSQKQAQERFLSQEKEKKQLQQTPVVQNKDIDEMKQQINVIMELLKNKNSGESQPKRDKSPKKKSRKETSKEREDKLREGRIQRRLEQKEKERLELERQEIERQELNKKEIEKRQKKQEKERKLQEKRELEEIKERERKQKKEQERQEQLKKEELKHQEEFQKAQRKLMIEREAEIERNRQNEMMVYQMQQQHNYRNEQYDYNSSRPGKKQQYKQRFFYDKIDNLYPPQIYSNQQTKSRARDEFQGSYDLKPYRQPGPPTSIDQDQGKIDMVIAYLTQMKLNK